MISKACPFLWGRQKMGGALPPSDHRNAATFPFFSFRHKMENIVNLVSICVYCILDVLIILVIGILACHAGFAARPMYDSYLSFKLEQSWLRRPSGGLHYPDCEFYCEGYCLNCMGRFGAGHELIIHGTCPNCRQNDVLAWKSNGQILCCTCFRRCIRTGF